MPPGFVKGDRSRIRQIQTAIVRSQRNSKHLGRADLLQDRVWKTAGFRAQDKSVTRPKPSFVERDLALRTQPVDTRRTDRSKTGIQVLVLLNSGEFSVIKSCTPQLPVFDRETKRMNQMYMRTDIRTQAYRISGIRRYFRLIENQMEHDNAVTVRAPRRA